MTLKEAILLSLEDLNKITNYSEIHSHIVARKYYDFGTAKTPGSTVSAILGDFIRNGDNRVKRIKQTGGTYSYYLTKNEQNINLDLLTQISEPENKKPDKTKTFDERDLHKLLASFLRTSKVYSKTIFHEQSTYGKDSNQIWTHPDMVGVKFLNLNNKSSQKLLKVISQVETFSISSYELKKEINSDSELKKAFFQAVSNSSWANYGYLVVFELGDSLKEEIERLNQSFGIGVIQLNANPYQSRILYQPQYRKLDLYISTKRDKKNK